MHSDLGVKVLARRMRIWVCAALGPLSPVAEANRVSGAGGSVGCVVLLRGVCGSVAGVD